MTLTLRLPEDVEARLRKQAAAAGQDAAQFAATIVERAVSEKAIDDTAPPPQTSSESQISDKIEQFLERVNSLSPTNKPPQLKGLEAEFEQAIIEKHRREGGART